MKRFHYPDPALWPVLVLCALLLACASEPSVDESIKNETARNMLEEENRRQSEQLKALKDSLPKEQVKEIEQKNLDRSKLNEEVRAASSHKVKSDAEIEAMLLEWMVAYEASGSSADQARLREGLGKDPVLRDWGRKYPEKYKALQERFMAVEVKGMEQ